MNLLAQAIGNGKNQKDESNENPPGRDQMCNWTTQCAQCTNWLDNCIKFRVITGKDINRYDIPQASCEA